MWPQDLLIRREAFRDAHAAKIPAGLHRLRFHAIIYKNLVFLEPFLPGLASSRPCIIFHPLSNASSFI